MVIKSKKKRKKSHSFFFFFYQPIFSFFFRLKNVVQKVKHRVVGLPGKKYKQVNAEKNGSARRCL